jgi:type II secretory pathway pseudopilin PulG
MAIRALICTVASVAVLAVAGAASAQTWSAEQQEIWKLEEQQWQMAKDKDLTWIDKMVHPSLSYWDIDQPSPQNKASLGRWNRYNNTTATVLEQELFPISVTITGNVAVVHYRYTIARESYKKERETFTGRYTDVLVKEGGRWLFIAWAGGDDPKK